MTRVLSCQRQNASKLPQMGKSLQSKVLTGVPLNPSLGEQRTNQNRGKYSFCRLVSSSAVTRSLACHEAGLNSHHDLAPKVR